MIPPAYEEIGFGWNGHRAALRYLAAAYRINGFQYKLRKHYEGSKDWFTVLRGGMALWLHSLPYLAVACAAGGWVVHAALEIATTREDLDGMSSPLGVAGLVVRGFRLYAFALLGALLPGFIVRLCPRTHGRAPFDLVRSIAVGVAIAVVLGLCVGLGFSISDGLPPDYIELRFAIVIACLLFGLGCLTDARERVVLVAVCTVSGFVLGDADGGLRHRATHAVVSCFLAGAILFRFYYWPVHWAFRWFLAPDTFRRWHPVFWDFNCVLSFPRLDELLVCYAEHARTDGLAQIEKLVSEYPSQRAAALRARTILTARATADATHLTMLDELIADLPEGDKGYLTQTRKVRERVLAISRHQRYVDSVNRPFFCEQALMGLRAEINAFYAQVGGYREPLATEFRKAAEAWLKLADQQIAEVQGQRRREPTPQVFRAGDPVLRDAEAFVARLDVCGALEHEIMAGPGCSGLLLYGRRRLGKSTVLRNLDGFLPKPVMALVVSMQNPRAFCSEASLAALLGEDIRQIWPGAASLGPEPKDLATLFQFLEACNTRLEVEQRRLVLGVDEFEELDRRVGLKQFTEDLAAALRESVQSHRRIIWVFAGSHHFSELPNVRWSSYLVSLRTIDLPPFSVEETRLLLSQPLKHARSEAARAAVAVFGSGFWGEDGMDRIHVEAGGWPHLVQLIASTVVDLCNTQGKRRADSGVLDEAMAKAVVSGDSVLAELLLYRSGELPAAWAYLSGFRKRDVQPVPEDDACRLTLKRHLLVRETPDGQWALRVPLMQRWLRERT